MHTIPNNAPTNVAALDERDPNAGNASHEYGIQYGGPGAVLRIQFQHGPRGVEGSAPGIFDDDLLAIIEDRMVGFQTGSFASPENQTALEHIRAAREALGLRVARRIAQGVLGANAAHVVPSPTAKDTIAKYVEDNGLLRCTDCKHIHADAVACGAEIGLGPEGIVVTCGCTSKHRNMSMSVDMRGKA